MTRASLQTLIDRRAFPDTAEEPELIETHISWIVLTDQYAFKIKRPLQFAFLDFSTLDKRKYFCHREVLLNRRLAPETYLGTLPIRMMDNQLEIGGEEGEIVDYVVWMKKLDPNREMDHLLENGAVKEKAMIALAGQLAVFHSENQLREIQLEISSLQEDFAGIQDVFDVVKEEWGVSVFEQLKESVDLSNTFLKSHQKRIKERAELGFVVDGHGDLHSGNIFIMDQPVIFDCIEFDDHLRQLDILNELAFLCMDLDSFNRADLAKVFVNAYLEKCPCMSLESDRQLLLYYQWYRANVRLKINCLHASNSGLEKERSKYLKTAAKYLKLFQKYMESIWSVSR